MTDLGRGGWKVWAQKDDYNRQYRIAIIRELPDGARDFLTFGTVTRVQSGYIAEDDVSARVPPDFLQAFLDCAWEQGLRPTGYSNVHEAIKATDRHLQDMRAIAFGKLNLKAPEGK